jgi:glycine cleavage system H protein
MSAYPDDRLYSKSHEWVRMEGDVGTIGITDHAQKELGEIVYVELPQPGELVDAEQELGTIESVKAVSELFSPVAGEVVETNPLLTDEPGAVNEDPHGEGWLMKVRVSTEPQGLLTAAQYDKLIEEEARG